MLENRCPHCDHIIDIDSFQYCSECGGNLDSVDREMNIQCENCNSWINRNTQACPICGIEIIQQKAVSTKVASKNKLCPYCNGIHSEEVIFCPETGRRLVELSDEKAVSDERVEDTGILRKSFGRLRTKNQKMTIKEKVYLGIAGSLCIVFVFLIVSKFNSSSTGSEVQSFAPINTILTNKVTEDHHTVSEVSEVTKTIIKTKTKPPTIMDWSAMLVPMENTPRPIVYSPISNCASSRVSIGDFGFISLGGGRNSIRSTADTHPSDNILGYAYSGDYVEIIDGPVCNFGWILWKVTTMDRQEGWTPESNGEEFWIEPGNSWKPCKNALPSKLYVDSYAKSYPSSASLLEQPETDSKAVGQIKSGDELLITDGAICENDVIWWQVKSLNTGKEGWTPEVKNNEYYLYPYLK